jgi:hypothetical protein
MLKLPMTNFIIFDLKKILCTDMNIKRSKCEWMFQMGTSLKFTGLNVFPNPSNINRINGVMVSMLASSEIDRGFDPRSGKTKDY